MSERLKRFLLATQATDLPTSKGDLVVVPPRPRPLAELAADIRKGHEEVTNALVSGAAAAIRTGKDLMEAKARIKHGSWEKYVPEVCGLDIRTAQNYMRMAKHEDQLRQWAEAKAQGIAFLTQSEALKFIDVLRTKKKRKKGTT